MTKKAQGEPSFLKENKMDDWIKPYKIYFKDEMVIRAREKLKAGQRFTLFRLTPDWANSVEVGDPVELWDRNTMVFINHGIVRYVTKTRCVDVSEADRILYFAGMKNGHPEKHPVIDRLRLKFARPIEDDTVVTVICIEITEP